MSKDLQHTTKELQYTIENNIKEIFTKETNEIGITKSMFELSQRFQHQTVIAFLNVYSELFNESSENKLKPKDISRILSSSLPFNLSPFMDIFQKNPQDLARLLDSFEKFSKSFPITHSSSSNYYNIPLFLSSLLLGSEDNLNKAISINPSFFKSSSFQAEILKIINIAITSKNNNAVDKLYEQYPQFFDYSVVNTMINSQYSDLNFLTKIVQSPNFSKTDTQQYELTNGEKITSSFSAYLAFNALIRNNTYDWDLFKKFNAENPLSLNDTIELNGGNKTRFSEILVNQKNQELSLNMFKEIYSQKPFNEVDTILFFRHYLSDKEPSHFIHACADPFFKTVLNNPVFSSSLLNRTEIMESLMKLETSDKYKKYLTEHKIFLKPALAFLNDLIDAYPEDFAKMNLHAKYIQKESSEDAAHHLSNVDDDLKPIILKSLYQNIEMITKQPVSSYSPITIQNLTDLGLVNKKVELEKTRGFMFTNSKIKETINFDWNKEAIALIIKNNEKQKKKSGNFIDVFEFLTGDDNQPLDVSLIEGISDESTKGLAKNIVLMIHSYKELDIKSKTVIPSEEMYFLDNRVGIMLSRLIKTYQDYKHYEQSDANRVLQAQLFMLQNRTSQAIHTVMLDEKQRLEQNVRINDQLLSKPINPLISPSPK